MSDHGSDKVQRVVGSPHSVLDFGSPLNSAGFTLTQTLVNLALMSIMMLIFTRMMTTQQNEVRALSETLAALDVERQLIASFSNSDLCTREITDPAFNPSSVAYRIEGDLDQVSWSFTQGIHLNESDGSPFLLDLRPASNPRRLASPLSQSLVVQRIVMDNFSASGQPNVFRAQLRIIFDPETTLRALRPIPISLAVRIEPTTNRPVGCLGSGPTELPLGPLTEFLRLQLGPLLNLPDQAR